MDEVILAHVDSFGLGDALRDAIRGDIRRSFTTALMSNRRLLFVTYGFPPLRGSGCVRTWNIAKYLARAGWTVTVLTVDPSLWRNVEHPQEVAASLNGDGIRRLSTDHRWRWLATGH